jgi:hypothetical protein
MRYLVGLDGGAKDGVAWPLWISANLTFASNSVRGREFPALQTSCSQAESAFNRR